MTALSTVLVYLLLGVRAENSVMRSETGTDCVHGTLSQEHVVTLNGSEAVRYLGERGRVCTHFLLSGLDVCGWLPGGLRALYVCSNFRRDGPAMVSRDEDSSNVEVGSAGRSQEETKTTSANATRLPENAAMPTMPANPPAMRMPLAQALRSREGTTSAPSRPDRQEGARNYSSSNSSAGASPPPRREEAEEVDSSPETSTRPDPSTREWEKVGEDNATTTATTLVPSNSSASEVKVEEKPCRRDTVLRMRDVGGVAGVEVLFHLNDVADGSFSTPMVLVVDCVGDGETCTPKVSTLRL